MPNLDSPKYQNTKKRKRDGEADSKDDATAAVPKAPRAKLVLKTYDPESGVVLKFKTDRAAEVGRLIAGLGRLGRHMAALPEKTEGTATATQLGWGGSSADTVTVHDTVMEDALEADKTSGSATPAVSKDSAAPAAEGKTQQAPSAGGAGGKKKKKGKR